MSELMLLYRYPVGSRMTTGLWSFNNPHPLRLVLVLLYLISSSFTVVNTLLNRHDKSFVVHVLEPGIKQCLKGPYVILESSTNKEGSYLFQTFLIPLIL